MLPSKKRTHTSEYRGHKIEVCHYVPDYLCEVDGSQVGSFWVSTEAAVAGAKRHIDHIIREEQAA